MRRRMLMATLAGVTLVRPARAEDATSQGMAERFAATLTRHDIQAFAALFAEDYRNHQVSAATPPPPAGKTAKQATVDFFAARLAGMPDLRVSVEAMVASADKVAASFVYTGTHTGPLYGVAPTGRTLRFTSCDIFLLRDGVIAEHWGMGDIAGTLAQIRS